ncbi:protein mini spindles-like [Zootermopsis nevadensis]|uniref:Cytoskeleton-associated protein 5 n=1 Tax=Zootermopsis nevadensis TaxID=136037 RepID=A0A067R1Z4_ZOONE|nr:protein mini spindles-like [Zootermopsis nevadensis]XP_021934206.1 protein mini spindles-like [Zootermopsis nevadensis]KDR11671.1 Cytoskeleton-associated protein 5 [Zootermopsis nevadensis]
MLDEQNQKVPKWNVTTPRKQSVKSLKKQMLVSNVNKKLLTYMFHSDFKFHLRAIDALRQDLTNNTNGTIDNLDMILKWFTLRFFDKKPPVLLKGLEYLQAVFTMLIAQEYKMLEYEASSFIPYLILKIGYPMDAVWNGVQALLRQIEQVYPAAGVFEYLMKGLKSKNAECLEHLRSLIENNGVEVCKPDLSAAVKEIARQVSYRGSFVREALDCIVQVYFIEKDNVYEMIGEIPDEDLSVLKKHIEGVVKDRGAQGSHVSQEQQQQDEEEES